MPAKPLWLLHIPEIIEFSGTEDLLRKLYELSQAASHGFREVPRSGGFR